jgi:deoxyribose-phosphate aldolase
MIKIRGEAYTAEAFAKKIDISYAAWDATDKDIVALCEKAKRYGFHAAATQPCFIDVLVRECRGTDVLPVSGIDMPSCADSVSALLYMAGEYIDRGAKGFDTPIPMNLIKDHKWGEVEAYLFNLQGICEGKAVTNIIPEVERLTPDELAMCAQLISKAGCDAVKCGTGSTSRGPLPADFKVIRENISGRTGIMATGPGNYWTVDIVLAFFLHGATVLSSGKADLIIDSLAAYEQTYRQLEIV